MERIKKLLRDEEGATMVEYALMVSLVAVACVVAVTALGANISGTFNTIVGSL